MGFFENRRIKNEIAELEAELAKLNQRKEMLKPIYEDEQI